jgi:exopolyphosphatase/guanosine-5'-triphosphate,3'-diphosphate pyrophosphatase
MVVARLKHGELQLVDRVRERVALAEGLDHDKRLVPDAIERALACLSRFHQRLGDMPQNAVRAVGTNTLRRAKNSRELLSAAREALGHPIEVISGREEARLIYLGVSHSHSGDVPRRLVIDIGGGSTECILGEGFEPLVTDSLRMGHIGYTRIFFPTGAITREGMRAARLAARLEVQGIERSYKSAGWDVCIGSSGTIVAVAEVLEQNGWGDGSIQRAGLRKLRKALVAAGDPSQLELPGLAADRKPVISGGVAILTAVFDALGIERMEPSPGALREGLLYDLLGRIRQEDVRDRTIRSVTQRYHVDLEHALLVERTARNLIVQVKRAWDLERPQDERMLGWASRLHEIGLSISFAGHHKHGAYLARHSDMAGFSRGDQELLAALILNHRRKPRTEVFGALLGELSARRLCVLLRLAVLLNRSRSRRALPQLDLLVADQKVQLSFPEGWLDDHPLTRADLAIEVERLEELGFELTVVG